MVLTFTKLQEIAPMQPVCAENEYENDTTSSGVSSQLNYQSKEVGGVQIFTACVVYKHASAFIMSTVAL